MKPSNCGIKQRLATFVLTGLALALALSGCGGDGVVNPGSGGTGNTDTTAIGPITGFGSVIVNGVRYDDSAASVNDDKGTQIQRDDLRLGMMVQVRGSTDSTGNAGVATSIATFSEIKGFVDSLTPNGFLVNGVTVLVVGSTVLDGASTISNSDFVEVYGSFNRTRNELIATRVEKKTPQDFKLRGVVTGWDQANSRFMLNSLTVLYAGVTLPSGFDDGVSVRAYGSNAPNAGQWQVSELRIAGDGSGIGDGRLEIKGVVTGYTSLSDFTLNDIPVDGSNAVIEGGTASDIRPDAWLEVEGRIESGTLVATEIEIEDQSGSGASSEFEIKGVITSLVSAADFVVRNTRVDASQSPQFEDGTAANLVTGACVEIKGELQSTSSGSTVKATRIKFDDDCN